MEEFDKEKLTKEDFEAIPVHYCKRCLSLAIIGVAGMEFCNKCGATNIEETSNAEWDKLYEGKFHHKYLESY
jgi:hypothetical protein